MSNAEFIFQNNYLKISNFNYHQNDIYYNTLFHLEVRSGAFCGVSLCEYDIKEFRKFIEELTELYEFKTKVVILNDISYGSNVIFKSDRTGHIEISGEIFGDGMEHSLKFCFSADQSVLKQFISELKKLPGCN